jgi:tetratricopeptide (TPR) repeat protein/tRNA A-37 threonylcarbamoyl transferase component Bud32
MLGKTVGGRYQIIRHLGGGGFGQTYLAEDWHLPGKPQCVVKQLKPKVTDAKALQTARRLFDREAEVLYSLGNHDQIPRLFAHFEENQEFYLVQEFIEGAVLSRLMKAEGVFSEEQVILLLQDILTTLEFVHQQHVIHRDIKPSNLIRRKSDQKIVLIDFGAVKQIGVASDESEQTTATIAIGSMGYMPNEQLAGKPRYSSDVYAVGMIGIRALTGLYPAQLSEDWQTGEIRWRDKADVSTELADILDQMIRYDFRQRYQSAAEALNDLNQLSGSHYETAISTLKMTSLNGQLAWFERGDELFQLQRYREAVACYDKVIQVIADDYFVWFKRGIALENLQEYEEAIASYDQVLQMHPEDYLAWFKRGKALENLQRYEEALTAYDKVVEIQPDNYWAWHDRGKVLEYMQRYEEAVASYDRAVQIKPDFQPAALSRKQVLRHLEQVDQLFSLEHYDEAVASCDRTLRENPQDALAWLMRGMALENLQRYDEAVASYDQVVQLQPEDHLAWFKRGAALEQIQRLEEALTSYSNVVQLQPEHHWAWHDRGRVLEMLHNYEAALVSYDKAVQIKPDLDVAIAGRQRVLDYLKQGNTTQIAPAETVVG